ncbi:hypothetical protein [Emticicia sp. 17c]|uniref:hypothetical protein n=1 Tax=Emticicia sp. 17c TaxID=3127704 RepID=UPI00301C7DE1
MINTQICLLSAWFVSCTRIENLDGTTANFSPYNIQWMLNGNPMEGAPNAATLSTDKIGEYVAILSLKMRPENTCEAKVNINAIPCKVYDGVPTCGTAPSNIEVPSTTAAGINLSIGDKFTVGDYTVVVTEITSGGAGGWNGKGYIEFKLINNITINKVAVLLENAVINECYQLAGGKIVTQYDTNWGNILDADEIIDDALSIYKKVSNNLTDLFSVFSGTCDEVLKIESEVKKLESALQLDPTQDASNNEVTNAIADLKASIISLKTCANCGSSSILNNNQINSMRTGALSQDCNTIFKSCEQKKEVFDQKTILDKVYEQTYYCKLVKKASETPCAKDNQTNCYVGGEVRIALTFFQQPNYVICRDNLKPNQWIVWRGDGSSWNPWRYDEDEISFYSAAVNNVRNRLHTEYPSIAARNAWYRWADKIARPKDNYWFAAAADVTSWRAVGAADNVNAWYVYDEDEFIMRGINKRLLEQNFKNFGDYLITPGAKIKDVNGNPVNLTGPALEAKMVEIEQQEVENYIAQTKYDFQQRFGNVKTYCANGLPTITPWECSIYSINRTSEGDCTTCYLDWGISFMYGKWNGDAFSKAMSDFKNGVRQQTTTFDFTPTGPYDFLSLNHRIYIGQRMAKYIRLGFP